MSGGIGKIELSVKDTKLKNQTALGLLDFSIVQSYSFRKIFIF